MHFSVSFKVLGLLLMVFSSTMLTPLVFALVEGEVDVLHCGRG